MFYKGPRCNGKHIVETHRVTRDITDIPKPQPVQTVQHRIPQYWCRTCHVTVQSPQAQKEIPKKGNLGKNLCIQIMLVCVHVCLILLCK